MITATATDSGGSAGWDEIILTVNGSVHIAEVRVTAGTDDAEEKASGKVDTTKVHHALVDEKQNQTLGLRFAGMPIPQGATLHKTAIWSLFPPASIPSSSSSPARRSLWPPSLKSAQDPS
jgi:hypothetical protein